MNELGFEWNLQKRKREDIEPQPLQPLAASINGNEENTHPNNTIVFENKLANEEHIVKKSKTRITTLMNQESVKWTRG